MNTQDSSKESESMLIVTCLVNFLLAVTYCRKGPTISTLTLNDPCVMVMYEAQSPEGEENYNFRTLVETGRTVSVLLERRSMLVLKGESRYYWKHGIPKDSELELPSGELWSKTEDYRRVSVSFRSLVSKSCAPVSA